MLARCKQGSTSQVPRSCGGRYRYLWRRLYGFGSTTNHMSEPSPPVPDKQGGRRMKMDEGEVTGKEGKRNKRKKETKQGDEGRR